MFEEDTPFDLLMQAVQKRFPQVNPISDRSDSSLGFGSSYIDCKYKGRFFSILLKGGRTDFGLAITGKAQDECGEDESYPTQEELLNRVEKLIRMIDDLESL